MKEYSIVTGLRCHPPSESLLKVTPLKKPRENKASKSIKVGKKDKSTTKTAIKTNKNKEKINNENELLTIVGPSYKVNDLLADLKNNKVLKKHKE